MKNKVILFFLKKKKRRKSEKHCFLSFWKRVEWTINYKNVVDSLLLLPLDAVSPHDFPLSLTPLPLSLSLPRIPFSKPTLKKKNHIQQTKPNTNSIDLLLLLFFYLGLIQITEKHSNNLRNTRPTTTDDVAFMLQATWAVLWEKMLWVWWWWQRWSSMAHRP